MACKKLTTKDGQIWYCGEDNMKAHEMLDITACRVCKQYEESNNPVQIVLYYETTYESERGHEYQKRIDMPNMCAARRCIKRNLTEYLKPIISERDQEEIIICYLTRIMVFENIHGAEIPCKQNAEDFI